MFARSSVKPPTLVRAVAARLVQRPRAKLGAAGRAFDHTKADWKAEKRGKHQFISPRPHILPNLLFFYVQSNLTFLNRKNRFFQQAYKIQSVFLNDHHAAR